MPVVKVLAVREPYKYWQSLFKYSWLESGPSFVAWWLSEHGERSKALRRQGTLQTFAHFMRWVEAEGEAMTGGLSQSGRLHRACGEPCQFDRVLHTENLAVGWNALVEELNLPRVSLPRLNAVKESGETLPDTTLTNEVIGIINRLDTAMFSDFGYGRRVPNETLSSPSPPAHVCFSDHCTDVNADCCAPSSLNEPATCAHGYVPLRTGPCGSFYDGAYVCCGQPEPPSAGMAELLAAFKAGGLFIQNIEDDRDWERRLLEANTLDDVPVSTDCGVNCTAMSLFHPRLPVQTYCPTCLTLVYAASGELWDLAQCAAVADSNSANRACGACFEAEYCPFKGVDKEDSGYCREACTDDPAGPLCHQLAAGCAHNLRAVGDEYWGEMKCSEADVKGGQCELCRQPAFCDASTLAYGNDTIATPAEWMARFSSKEQIPDEQRKWTQDHQCFFRGSQRDTFVETARAYALTLRAGAVRGFPWNEINFFSDKGRHDRGLQPALMRNLVGIFDMQGDGARLDDVAEKLARLGRPVPRFTLRGAAWGELHLWDPLTPVELRGWPYSLEERQ